MSNKQQSFNNCLKRQKIVLRHCHHNPLKMSGNTLEDNDATNLLIGKTFFTIEEYDILLLKCSEYDLTLEVIQDDAFHRYVKYIEENKKEYLLSKIDWTERDIVSDIYVDGNYI